MSQYSTKTQKAMAPWLLCKEGCLPWRHVECLGVQHAVKLLHRLPFQTLPCQAHSLASAGPFTVRWLFTEAHDPYPAYRHFKPASAPAPPTVSPSIQSSPTSAASVTTEVVAMPAPTAHLLPRAFVAVLGVGLGVCATYLLLTATLLL